MNKLFSVQECHSIKEGTIIEHPDYGTATVVSCLPSQEDGITALINAKLHKPTAKGNAFLVVDMMLIDPASLKIHGMVN